MGQEKEAKKTDGRVTETDPEKKAQMKDHRKRLRDRCSLRRLKGIRRIWPNS